MQNSDQLKSGFLTSEFWLSLGTTIAGLLTAIGLLTPAQADQFVQAVVSVVGGLVTLGSIALYIYGRIELKKGMMDSSSQEPELIEGIPDNLETSIPTQVPGQPNQL